MIFSNLPKYRRIDAGIVQAGNGLGVSVICCLNYQDFHHEQTI
jgi:hypothetical protein